MLPQRLPGFAGISKQHDWLKDSRLITSRRSVARHQRFGATIRVHVDQERNSSSAVEELHSIEMASVTPRVTLGKNADTSVEQIERFYARNLPLSKEMAINLQSFGGSDED